MQVLLLRRLYARRQTSHAASKRKVPKFPESMSPGDKPHPDRHEAFLARTRDAPSSGDHGHRQIGLQLYALFRLLSVVILDKVPYVLNYGHMDL